MSDADARHAIRTDLASTFVVEAGAGTGKTTELIARILAAITSGGTTLERIVAVTFTDKAAGEMKLRLRTELEAARSSAAPEAAARLEVALGELEVARIGTIHQFCADLLRERPIEAGVDPLFEVAADDEATRIYNEAFDGWFQRSVAAPGEGVRRMLRRAEPSEQLRGAGYGLVGRRDFNGAWRRDPFDRDGAIDRAIEELAALAQLAGAADKPSDPLARLFVRIQTWLDELRRREAVRGRDFDGLEVELRTVMRWQEWRYDGRTVSYGSGITRREMIERRDAARLVLEQLVQAADADLAPLLFEELFELVGEHELAKQRAGRLDFLDLLVYARDLLARDAAVLAEMQRRFTHVYVDEFQDTDPLQVEILWMLCARPDDPARIVPGKLFVVGDPKQAIYRFRRADVTLYETVKQRLVEDGARLVHLTTSYRSVPELQAAVNAAFEPVMRGDGQARYVALERAREGAATQPALVALPVPRPYGDSKSRVTQRGIEQSYPEAAAAFVDHLTRHSGWTVTERTTSGRVPLGARHVCLMFRRFQSWDEDLTRPYVEALEARGIPHVLVGGRSFHEREEVEAVRNGLAAIEWPDDELSVYATLRGPLFALSDDALLGWRHEHGRLDPIRIPAGTTGAVPEALAVLGELHGVRNRRAIADTVARLLGATRAHAGFAMWPAGEQALANVMRMIDLARRFEARGAISFRAFIDKLESDARLGRQPDAPVVEEGVEGVRVMTVHSAKGLEFPVVILCDPTAPLAQKTPSRHIDPVRRVWLEPIAGCVPIELREREEEVLRRDREEGVRLAYVAATRARDLLVVPTVGDEERENWLSPLIPAVHPHPAARRRPAHAPGCPAFGPDSVVSRGIDANRGADDSVAPGEHAPRAGEHRVVWWDPNLLVLGQRVAAGLRQRQILVPDETSATAELGERTHASWAHDRTVALELGGVASVLARSVTDAAKGVQPRGDAAHVAIEETAISRTARPNGRRLGSLVHAVLATVPLRAGEAEVRGAALLQGRIVGAPADEIEATVAAVLAALAHPLLVRAASAGDAGALRREVPIVLRSAAGLLEGIIDLAFAEPAPASPTGRAWTVVDFKTDPELGAVYDAYAAQVRMYAEAITAATGEPASCVLLLV